MVHTCAALSLPTPNKKLCPSEMETEGSLPSIPSSAQSYLYVRGAHNGTMCTFAVLLPEQDLGVSEETHMFSLFTVPLFFLLFWHSQGKVGRRRGSEGPFEKKSWPGHIKKMLERPAKKDLKVKNMWRLWNLHSAVNHILHSPYSLNKTSIGHHFLSYFWPSLLGMDQGIRELKGLLQWCVCVLQRERELAIVSEAVKDPSLPFIAQASIRTALL